MLQGSGHDSWRLLKQSLPSPQMDAAAARGSSMRSVNGKSPYVLALSHKGNRLTRKNRVIMGLTIGMQLKALARLNDCSHPLGLRR